MELCLVVNEFESFDPGTATALLTRAIMDEGHDVAATTVAELAVDENGAVVGRRHSLGRSAVDDSLSLRKEPGAALVPLSTFDGVLCRTNPARDSRQGLQTVAHQLLGLASARGLPVLNDPLGLARACSKAYLAELPAHVRPRTICSADERELRTFVDGLDGPAVLKPALGTHGQSVFKVVPGDGNVKQILQVILERGMVMAQEYVAAAEDGDTRVLLVGGEVLRLDGIPAAVRRVPGRGDFRSNVHAGGQAAPGEVTAGMEAVVRDVGPKLMADGLFFVGLDFIGDVVCEVNVCSPGGLFDMERFTGLPFARELARRFAIEVEHRLAIR